MYQFILIISGGMIALMVTLNGNLSQSMSLTPALVLIHLTGLMTSMLLSDKKIEKAKPVPLPYYSAGLLGIVVTLADLACVTQIGVTLTLALKLMGQLLGSYLIDLKGIPGLPRQKPGPERLLTLLIASAGCFYMMDLISLLHWAVWLTILAGMTQSFCSGLNAALGSQIGTFKAVKTNFATGLIGSLLLFSVSGVALENVLSQLFATPWPILFGGGICAVIIVSACTLSFRHVSLLTATLLLFLGQLGFGNFFDLLSGHELNTRMILGGLIMLSGLGAEGLWVWLKQENYLAKTRRNGYSNKIENVI